MDIVKHREFFRARPCMKLHDKRYKRWQEFSVRLRQREQSGVRLLLLAAHPDDESIGASVLLPKFMSSVVFLTDGAPRDSSLWTGGPYRSHEEYAARRRVEAARALAVAGIPNDRIRWLGGTDQEAVARIGELAQKLGRLLLELEPELLVTHPYEGGHPDHDAAALIARRAGEQLAEKRPQLVEMTSYHIRNGACVTGEFLPFGAVPELAIEFSKKEKERKATMLAAHESQQVVLGRFRVDRELFRAAPEYDFSKAPHPGKLWYECMNWGITGERWRQLAGEQTSPSAVLMRSRSCG
jgi:N-acetylglucosamine malate deacetylase 2